MRDYRLLLRVLWLAMIAATPGFCFLGKPSTPDTEGLREIERQVYKEVNQLRQSANIGQLSWNETLAAEARQHAQNMAGNRFFAHEDPERGDLANRLNQLGIKWHRCAENLYEKSRSNDPAKEAVGAWFDSPGHRRNMMNSVFRYTGVGAALQPDGTLIIVQQYLLP
jgi:uncharacterized protein YkwD